MNQLENKTKDKEIEEYQKRFNLLHEKFVINNVNKIQRYLVNNLGLKPIKNKKPLNTAKVRQFVTLTEHEGTLQYCIKVSYGTKRVATIPINSTEYDEDAVVNALKGLYQDLQEDVYIADFWNLVVSDPLILNNQLLKDTDTATTINVIRQITKEISLPKVAGGIN